MATAEHTFATCKYFLSHVLQLFMALPSTVLCRLTKRSFAFFQNLSVLYNTPSFAPYSMLFPLCQYQKKYHFISF